jgi:D-threo-aldose 1-dehydrogenase
MESKGYTLLIRLFFHSGFLVGGNYFDYHLVTPGTPETNALFVWREEFFKICKQFNIKPAEACVRFALHVPGVKSIALNTTNAKQIKANIDMPNKEIPFEFWEALQLKGLIEVNFFNNLESVF